MKLKLFTFSFNEATRTFDDNALQEFLVSREVVEKNEYFFIHQGLPHLLLVLSYRELLQDERRQVSLPRRKEATDDLDPAERLLFEALRTWRSARAKQDGVPPYVILTNRQLVRLVRLKAATKTDLLKVEGLGEEKLHHYGEELLKVLDTFRTAQPQPLSEETREA